VTVAIFADSTDAWGGAEGVRRRLQRSHATAQAARQHLAAARARLRRRGPSRMPEHDGDADIRSLSPDRNREPFRLEAWLELGDGSAEQGDQIQQAVYEIVQLQHLFVEALCRHFPAIGPSIREVAQHLFEDASNLTDPNCCRGAGSVVPRQTDGRLN
jgi:hypothetical protein